MLWSSAVQLLITWGSLSLLSEAKTVRHTVEKRSSVCYEDLGCFSSEAPFQSVYRPLSLLPQSPEIVNPTFTLRSRQDPTIGHRLTAGDSVTLGLSTFRASRPTKILVHGFFENPQLASWMQGMTTEFLKQGDYNVITVDWGFASMNLYGQASANARVVGAMIAQLITFLQNTTDARLDDMHIIGHSLGCHVAGYAGERLRHLGRITGLDPAGPYFQNMDEAVRLDPSDALFVDVIHTDDASVLVPDMGLGMSQACGHVDFYVNGGHDQPGCKQSPVFNLLQYGVVEGTRQIFGCNHARAYHLFQESINSACPFEGYRCASHDDFNQGKCLPCSGEDCGYMGLHADRIKPTAAPATNKYYLKTGTIGPFCRYHYKVALTFASPYVARQERGTMYVTVIGSQGRIEESKLNQDDMYIQPGLTYTYLLTSPVELGDIHDVRFRWVHNSDILDFGSWNPLGLRHPQLYVDNIQVDSGEEKKTKKLCAHGIAVETGVSTMIAGRC